MSEDSTDLDKKVYRTKDGHFSILDILKSATEAEHSRDGMPRISDFHFKVGYPVRFRYDDSLEELDGGEPLSEPVVLDLLNPLLSSGLRERFEKSERTDID